MINDKKDNLLSFIHHDFLMFTIHHSFIYSFIYLSIYPSILILTSTDDIDNNRWILFDLYTIQ